MEPARLPTHLQVGGLIRQVQAEGGFASVLARGERDAGTLMVVLTDRGSSPTAYERMPQPDGSRSWSVSRTQDPENPHGFGDYLERRKRQDPDMWIVELDVRNGERFIEGLADS